MAMVCEEGNHDLAAMQEPRQWMMMTATQSCYAGPRAGLGLAAGLDDNMNEVDDDENAEICEDDEQLAYAGAM